MLTSEAAQTIRSLVEAPHAAGIRILRAPDPVDQGGSGLQVELAAGPRPQDTVVELEGAFIFVAPEAERAMEGSVLDAHIEGEEVRFALWDQMEPET